MWRTFSHEPTTMLKSATRCLSASLKSHYKVAVVGAGPAGFYTAHHLLHKSQGIPIQLDFFDRLPTPFGLSRYGVAPDHPEVKNCEEYLENLMHEYPDNVRFFGNMNVGRDVSLSQLGAHYNSIVLAYGCTASDNKLDIPGADSPGVISAREFVNWYNGHPDWSRAENLHPPLDKVKTVTIIGNGNVAIDVARVLLADPTSHWAPTDITEEAVEVLLRSTVQRVNIVARRGLLESAFTNKEIRELIQVSEKQNIAFEPISDRILDPILARAKLLGRVDKRKVSLLEKASGLKDNGHSKKSWSLQFLLSPSRFIPSTSDPNLLQATEFEENDLVEDSLTKKVSIKPTGKKATIETELVILSIGYRGTALPGFAEEGMEFSARKNCIANKGGRILLSKASELSSVPELTYKIGWYTSGWIKKGPQGVIATTMMEAFDTAENILEDLTNGIYNEASSESDITDILSPANVRWSEWKKIEAHEFKTGQEKSKSRLKVRDISSMLEIAKS